jgi:hypothetical protein
MSIKFTSHEELESFNKRADKIGEKLIEKLRDENFTVSESEYVLERLIGTIKDKTKV